MLKTWNSLSIDVKSTADSTEFQNTLKQNYFPNTAVTLDVKTSHATVAPKYDYNFKNLF